MKTIKLTEYQQDRILKEVNILRELCNNISEGTPLDYHQVIELPSLEYLMVDLFDLELPKCEHNYANRWREYKFKVKGKKDVA